MLHKDLRTSFANNSKYIYIYVCVCVCVRVCVCVSAVDNNIHMCLLSGVAKLFDVRGEH